MDGESNNGLVRSPSIMPMITTLSLGSSTSRSLVEPSNVVLQVLGLLLVNGQKVGDIFLINPVAHEIGDKEFAQVAN